MKKLTATILACGIMGFGVRQAQAAAQLTLSDGTTTVTVVDEGPGDFAAGIPGMVQYVGPVGPNWYLDVTTGAGSPNIGSPSVPAMDIGSANNSSGAGTLTIDFTQDGFTAGGPATMNIGGITVGQVTYQVWVDPTNIPFAKTTLIGTVGPLAGGSGGSFSGSAAGIVPPGNPYSITMEATLVHSGGGHTGFDASLDITPPPCNCTVTFNSPTSITNCAGDAIPDVVASEDCGNGPTSVPVVFAGAVTNGTCPQIITRTNTAVDDCGKVSTFVQTITVNCKPDCTLTSSVTTAVTGTGGLHASVADAGPGANYFWTITNGSITNGQGTTNITFVAGPDAGQPTTICVSVSTGAGCVTRCCLDIPLTPRCDCTITFCSPRSITNCAGDAIPSVIAYQKCSTGSSNTVAVSVIGAKTNGSCPAIITRTNAAMSTCGDIFTFVQTITVNCRGTICGHIFADCDGNGDLTQGDVGLSKVVVSLLLSNKVLVSVMTDTNGGYCFTNLAGGCYVVAVTPPSGYSQTAASTSYHWKDGYGRDCWNENDGNIHCVSSGTECWWDKSSTCHWKDSYNRDCWKDNWGGYHCQPCSYQSCNADTNNNKISVCISNCASQGDVDFAYTGTKASLSVCVKGPSYVKCGQTYTYTCTVTNTGNVCFKGGTVCHTIGNCNSWGGWSYGCNNYNTTCPPLSPGQHCTITQKCTFNSWNCGTVACQSSVNCYQKSSSGSCTGQSTCYSQCGW